jgi:hypothetical protein
MTRYVLATLSAIAVAAAATCFICYRSGTDPEVHAAVQKGDALAWLRSDFNLDEVQFAAVKRLHDSYAVECEAHCQAIQNAARRREELKAQSPADATALAEAHKKVEELRVVCETAIAAHVRQVASHMSPEQGTRYLALVLPKIKDFDHQGHADVRVDNRHH